MGDYPIVINFRITNNQQRLLQAASERTGLRPAEIIRQLLDTLVDNPLVVPVAVTPEILASLRPPTDEERAARVLPACYLPKPRADKGRSSVVRGGAEEEGGEG